MMKTKFVYVILAALVATSSLTGCQKGEQLTPLSEHRQIKFNAFLKEGDNIRPMNTAYEVGSRAMEGTLNKGYTLSGQSHSKPYSEITTPQEIAVLFNNVGINAEEIDSPPQYWSPDKTKYYSFQAYASNKFEFIKLPSSSPFPCFIYYDCVPDPQQQADVLGAATFDVKIGDEAPVVNLYFEHRLSRLVFKLKRLTNGPTMYGTQLKITYGRYPPNHKCTISLDPNSPEGATNYTKNPTGTYPLMPEQTIPASNMDALFGGDMILCPQKLVKGWASISLYYSLTPTGPRTSVLTTELNAATLEPGKQIDYIIGYSIDTEQLIVNSVTLDNWNTIGVDVNEYK